MIISALSFGFLDHLLSLLSPFAAIAFCCHRLHLSSPSSVILYHPLPPSVIAIICHLLSSSSRICHPPITPSFVIYCIAPTHPYRLPLLPLAVLFINLTGVIFQNAHQLSYRLRAIRPLQNAVQNKITDQTYFLLLLSTF